MTEQTQRPLLRASDADREVVVGRLERCLSEGRISIDEFRQRAESAYAVVTSAELEPLLADLPADGAPRVEIVGRRSPARLFSVFGDIELSGGRASVPARIGTVLGNVRIDLRDLRTDAESIELHLSTVLGDVDVIVSEGVDAELQGWKVIGNRTTELAPVPRLAGTPRIVVRAHTVLGDLRLRSLAPGESVSRWRDLLDRLAQRPRPPAPSP